MASDFYIIIIVIVFVVVVRDISNFRKVREFVILG